MWKLQLCGFCLYFKAEFLIYSLNPLKPNFVEWLYISVRLT